MICVCLEIEFHAEERGSSGSGDNVCQMNLIDIVSVADIVDVCLQLGALADFILRHRGHVCLGELPI